MGGDSLRFPQPPDGVPAPPPQPGRDRPPGRHRRRSHLRGAAQRHRGQDPGAGSLQAVAGPGGGTQPPGVGGPGRLLLLRHLRRSQGRGDRHAGHRLPPVGLRSDTRRAGGYGLPPGVRGWASWAPTTSCTVRTRRSCRSGTSRPGTGIARPSPSSTPACQGWR